MTTITTRVSGTVTDGNTARVSGTPRGSYTQAFGHRLLLEGDAQSNGDVVLLEGDATQGNDAEALEGDARTVTSNHTTRVSGL